MKSKGPVFIHQLPILVWSWILRLQLVHPYGLIVCYRSKPTFPISGYSGLTVLLYISCTYWDRNKVIKKKTWVATNASHETRPPQTFSIFVRWSIGPVSSPSRLEAVVSILITRTTQPAVRSRHRFVVQFFPSLRVLRCEQLYDRREHLPSCGL